jgi:uncharacterized protein (TIGR04222 family)
MFAILHLPGPTFLVVFTLATIAALLLGYQACRWWETRQYNDRMLPTDPYEIAMLRGGAVEALKVAVLSLIDRGLVKHEKDMLTADQSKTRGEMRNPVERLVLGALRTPTSPAALSNAANIRVVHNALAPALRARNLLRNETIVTGRALILAAAAAFPAFLAIGKFIVAAQERRFNTGFLTILSILAVLGFWVLLGRERTGAGSAALESLRQLMGRLRDRTSQFRTGRNTNELAMLAAVFSLAAIPSGLAPYATGLDTRMRAPGGSDSSSGSGCGGGGDGGGGGGCGGCGGD